MLKSPTEFPHPGSFAFLRSSPGRRVRVIQKNADGGLLVSGSKDGRATTTTVNLDDLIPAGTATRAAA